MYNWITLLYTWIIVNQLYFNWKKKKTVRHQECDCNLEEGDVIRGLEKSNKLQSDLSNSGVHLGPVKCDIHPNKALITYVSLMVPLEASE